MSDESGHLGTALGIPHPRRAVTAGGQDAALIGVPDGPPHKINVSYQVRQFGTTLGVPYPGRAVSAGCQDAAFVAIEREYLCRVYGNPGKEALERLTKGIRIDGQLVRFYQLRRQHGENRNTWYSVVVTEGKYREVRRMWEAVGCKLSRLSRIRYGKVCLPRGPKPGGHVELDSVEIERLMKNRSDDTPFTPVARTRAKRRVNHR